MLESIFKRPDKLELARKCSLGNHIDHYLAHLLSLRYKKTTIINYARVLLNFAGFVDERERYHIRNLPNWISPFMERVKRPRSRKTKRYIIRSFVAGIVAGCGRVYGYRACGGNCGCVGRRDWWKTIQPWYQWNPINFTKSGRNT